MKNSILILFMFFLFSSCTEKKPEQNFDLFVGTYTDGNSEGIYKMTFNTATGQLANTSLAATLTNPSFLAISADKKNLYVVQETADYDSIGGSVASFSLNDGILKLLNIKGSGGAHPCHVAVSNQGQIAVSNYTGGNLAVYDLEEDGSLGERQLIEHATADTIKTPHVHKAHFNAEGLFVADLGLDALKRYSKQPYGWVPAHQNTIAMDKGAGPRHFVFNKSKAYLYVLNELNASISVLKQDDEGSYNHTASITTLPESYKGENACADIHLSADERFLYASNRGENTIVIFEVDAQTGELSLVGRTSVKGDWPRNFTLDPTGNFLLVANQKSSNITIFKRDSEKGTLEFLNEVEMPNPVCLLFVE